MLQASEYYIIAHQIVCVYVLASYPGLPMFFNVCEKIGKAWSICWCNLIHTVSHVVKPWLWSCPLRGWVGRDTKPRLKPCLITSPYRPGLPNFSRIQWKTWEGLDMRLHVCMRVCLIPIPKSHAHLHVCANFADLHPELAKQQPHQMVQYHTQNLSIRCMTNHISPVPIMVYQLRH